jgi:hypothetical protein
VVAPAPERPAFAIRVPREELALALLLAHPEFGAEAGLSEELFSLAENRELLRRFLAGELILETEVGLWDAFQRVRETSLAHLNEMTIAQAAFLDCLARLQQARMKAVKEATALALAEGEASLSTTANLRTGEVAALARATWEAGGDQEANEDDRVSAVASQLLQDTQAGLRVHERSIESSRGGRGDRPTG